uniref:Sushi domain-containing protein n=1 Tax=Haplochromis burtoni TaxID=8153 RepID=A0A3Q3BQU6_HAPBU
MHALCILSVHLAFLLVTCIRPQDRLLSHWEASWRDETKKLGDTVRYTCISGYKRKDGVTRATCTRDGWEPNPLCEGMVNPPPKVENAFITTRYRKQYPSGSEVTYQCRDKYTIEGNATLKCTAGEWKELNIQCIRTYIKIIYSEKTKYMTGDIIEYRCENRAGIIGTATCQHGKWAKTLECEGKETLKKMQFS